MKVITNSDNFLCYNKFGDYMKIVNAMKSKNIACGYLYFYVHFITEVVCFFYLSRITNSNFIWLIPFIYDGLAFVPQALIGYISDKYRKINMGILGVILFVIGYLIFDKVVLLSLVIISIANALIHVSGAESTLRNSEGKLSHSAIFVGGGSFGVITGRLLAGTSLNPLLLIPIILTMIPFIMLSDTYESKSDTKNFNYVNKKLNPHLIVFLAVLVVIIRGYMGYGIPTSWNKTTTQTVLLFFIMGIGKCAGGILSDAYGIRKIGTLSTLVAIPFLCLGDNLMIVSLIGVMFFSMTMSITLAILVSVLKDKPGLAFGLTTIGLFLGTAPIFFFKITSQILNISMIIILSILCSLILNILLKKGDM